MKKTVYVKDITNGTAVDDAFMIKRADLRAKRGEQYIHLTIADKTGVLEAKLYGEEAPTVVRGIQTGRVYRIVGTGKVPQGGSLLLQSESPESLEALLAGPMPLAAGEDVEYIYTPAKIAENAAELQKLVASIQNQNLRIFVACCLDSRFYECHRAQTLTHPLGGRTNLHIAHHTGTVTGTQVSIGRLHIQKLYQIALGTTLDNRDGETVPY